MADLISIRPIAERPAALCPVAKLTMGPMGDKFFVAALLIILVGVPWLGVHLWLMREGEMPISSSYLTMRAMHAHLQLVAFFSTFVLGFLVQSTPHLIATPVPRHPLLLLAVPGMLLATALIATGYLEFGRAVEALCISGVGGWFLVALSRAERVPRLGVGVPIVLSLCGYLWSIYQDVSIPLVGIVGFWGSTAIAILAVGQQFITNLLGGKKLSIRKACVVHTLIVISMALGVAAVQDPAGIAPHVFAWAVIGVLTVYGLATGLARCLVNTLKSPVTLAIVLSFMWAWVGAIELAMTPSNTDLVLHAWATGFGVTLTLAMSVHIVGFIGGKPALRRPLLFWLIWLWQVIPLVRGTAVGRLLGSTSIWVAASIASLVVLVWLVLLIQGEVRILTRQLALRSREQIPE